MDLLLVISILIEAAVAAIALFAARRSTFYLYGLSFTFGVYVVYDFVRLMSWSVDGTILSGIFLAASVSALISVIGIYFSSAKNL
jgi:hypothetical protein